MIPDWAAERYEVLRKLRHLMRLLSPPSGAKCSYCLNDADQTRVALTTDKKAPRFQYICNACELSLKTREEGS